MWCVIFDLYMLLLLLLLRSNYRKIFSSNMVDGSYTVQYRYIIWYDVYIYMNCSLKRERENEKTTKFRRGCCALPLSWRRCKLDYNNNNYNFIMRQQQLNLYNNGDSKFNIKDSFACIYIPLCACIFTLASSHLISRKYPIIIHRIPDKKNIRMCIRRTW